MAQTLYEHLHLIKENVPRQQQILCSFLCEHMAESAGMSAAELAKASGVSTSTILRTVKSLGFANYTELRHALRKEAFFKASSSLISYGEWDKSTTFNSKSHGSYAAYLDTCEKAIQQFHSDELFDQIDKAVDSLMAAKRIFVLGLRSSQPMAKLFEFSLIHSSLSISQLSDDISFLFDRVANITTQDILFCIAYRPVTKQSIDVLNICASQHIPVILLTNDVAYFSKYSAQTLSIPISALSPNVVTTAVMINMITCEIEKRLSLQLKMQLHRIETLADENSIEIWKAD